jgi:hypothetical protein
MEETKTVEPQTTQEKTQQEQPKTRADLVRNSISIGKREVTRDIASGRFAKSAKKREQDLVKSERSQDRLRDLLSKPRQGKKKPLEIELAEKLADNILTSTNEDLSGAAKAYEILQTRAWGRPAPSEQEKDALTRAGVRVVVLQAPDLPVVVEEERKPLLKPLWAKAEVVSENPPKHRDVPEDDQQ